ncbi:MAG: tetratricopeptide repeat protein [Phycisphaerales bacterium]
MHRSPPSSSSSSAPSDSVDPSAFRLAGGSRLGRWMHPLIIGTVLSPWCGGVLAAPAATLTSSLATPGSLGLTTALAATVPAAIGQSVPAADEEPIDEAVRRRLDAGNGLLARGEAALAVSEYESAIAALPESSQAMAIARYGLGLCHSRLGRPRAVVATLAPAEDWPATHPHRAESLLLLGESRRQLGDAAGALSALRRIAPAADGPLAFGVRRAIVESTWSVYDAASRTPAADALSTEAIAGLAVDLAGAVDAFLALDPPLPAARRAGYLAAVAAVRQRDDRQAIARLDRVLNGAPDAAFLVEGADGAILRAASGLRRGSHQRTGNIAAARRDAERLASAPARAAFNAAFEQWSDDAARSAAATQIRAAAVALGTIDLDAGRPADAVAALAAAAESTREPAAGRRAYGLLGRAQLAARDAAAAGASALRGIERHGDDGGRLGWILGRSLLERDQPSEAADVLAAVLEDGPPESMASIVRWDLTVARSAAGDDAGTADAASAVLAAEPNGPRAADAARLLAEASMALGRSGDAIAACDAFDAAAPDHPLSADVQRIRAMVHESTGDLDAAASAWAGYIERAERAADADEQSIASARARLGLVLHAAGRDADARPALEAATGPDAAAAVYRALGDIAYRAEDWPAAADALAIATERGIDDPAARRSARLRTARAARNAGDPVASIAAADALLDAEDAPVDVVAWAQLERGMAFIDLDRSRDADAALRACLAALGGAASGDAPDLAGALAASAAADGVDAANIRRAAITRLASLAEADERHGDAASAYAALEGVALGASASIDARRRQAGSLLRAGELIAAAELFESIASATDDAADAGESLARAALARCQAAGAAATVAAGAAPTAREAAVLGSVERALAASELPADLRAALRYERVRRLRAAGNPRAAMTEAEVLIRQDAASRQAPYAAIELADLRLESGAADQALAVLEGFMPAADDTDPVVRPHHADAAWRTAADWRRAVAFRRLERHADAAAAAERVLAAGGDPAFRRAVLALAGESRLAAGEPDAAAVHFESLAGDGGDADRAAAARLRLAEARAAQGRWAVAERHYRTYLERHPDDARWYAATFGLGRALEAQGRTDAAMEAYAEVAARHDGPTAARAQFQYGECLFVLGRHEDALRELLKVDILFDAPEWTAAALHEAASCLERLDRAGEAREMLARIVAEHPGSAWATRAARRLEASAAP